eukprot:6209412-Pleurochrysis_carterae.AAC.4
MYVAGHILTCGLPLARGGRRMSGPMSDPGSTRGVSEWNAAFCVPRKLSACPPRLRKLSAWPPRLRVLSGYIPRPLRWLAVLPLSDDQKPLPRREERMLPFVDCVLEAPRLLPQGMASLIALTTRRSVRGAEGRSSPPPPPRTRTPPPPPPRSAPPY